MQCLQKSFRLSPQKQYFLKIPFSLSLFLSSFVFFHLPVWSSLTSRPLFYLILRQLLLPLALIAPKIDFYKVVVLRQDTFWKVVKLFKAIWKQDVSKEEIKSKIELNLTSSALTWSKASLRRLAAAVGLVTLSAGALAFFFFFFFFPVGEKFFK